MLDIAAARFSLDAAFIHIAGIADLSIHCQLIYGNNTLIRVSLGYLFLIRTKIRQKKKRKSEGRISVAMQTELAEKIIIIIINKEYV